MSPWVGRRSGWNPLDEVPSAAFGRPRRARRRSRAAKLPELSVMAHRGDLRDRLEVSFSELFQSARGNAPGLGP